MSERRYGKTRKTRRGFAWRATGMIPIFLASILVAQEGVQPPPPAVGLPARAPGYELYYHSEDRANAFATRWGYNDGWRDGKHDRDLGQIRPATELDRYKMAPDHGYHPGITRSAYKSAYRTAYLHGYEYGTGRRDSAGSNP